MLLKWSSDPLGKQRPLISAGRFHLPQSGRVLYLARAAQTAGREVQAFGAPIQAVAIIPVTVELRAVLDLTDAGIRKKLRLTVDELAINFRVSQVPTPTQILGECCASLGVVDGLLFSSIADPGGVCLAVIESSLARLGSSLEINDRHSGLQARLP
jgi:hypothetical protein